MGHTEVVFNNSRKLYSYHQPSKYVPYFYNIYKEDLPYIYSEFKIKNKILVYLQKHGNLFSDIDPKLRYNKL